MRHDNGVGRDRVITVATRHALREDLRRARSHSVIGVLVAALGAGIALGAWTLPIGFPAMVVCGGIGLTLIPGGLAALARGAYAAVTAWRRIRELDERTGLPVARVHSG
jgi:hypothetical protein